MTDNVARRQVALHLLNHEFLHDQRVERSAVTTLGLGYRSILLCYNRSGMVSRELRRGVEVIRLDYGRGTLTRFLPKNLARLWNVVSITIRFVVAGISLRPAIIQSNDIQMLLPGWLISIFSGARFVYDAHELWSDELKFNMMPRFIKGMFLSYERFFARRADAVITVSPGIAAIMYQKLSLASLPFVVRNLPDPRAQQSQSLAGDKLRREFGLGPEARIILFQGNVSVHRNLNELVAAISLVEHPDIVLVILGDGQMVQPLRATVERMNLDRKVLFREAVPYKDLPEYTGSADLGACFQEAVSLNYRYSMPNKLFEYLTAGIPVMVGDTPDITEIVSAYQAGVAVVPVTPKNIAQAIDEILASSERLALLKEGAKRAGEALTWENERKVLISSYVGE